MLKEERFQLILSRLKQDQRVLLNNLSEELKVSEDTVRRDIKELSDQGLLKMVRGGAVPHSPIPHNFKERMHYDSKQKQIIAAKAISLLSNGQVAIFDGGTSALAVAAMLPKDLRITVITNSFPVANILMDHPETEVLFAGGRLFKSSFTAIGHDTLRFMQKVRADICFLGICSIHPELGVTGISYEECEVKKAMVNVSNQVVALSTMERLGTAETFHICEVTDLATIVTDVDPSVEGLQQYIELGIEIL